MFVFILILIFLTVFSYLIYRDVLNPTFLICLPWTYSFFMLIFLNGYYVSEEYFLYIIFGVFLFQLSYYIFDSFISIKHKRVHSNINGILLVNEKYINIFIWFEIFVCIFYGYYLYQFGINNYIGDMYQTLKTNETEIGRNVVGYLWNFIKVFSGFIYLLYLTKNIKNKYTVLVQLSIGMVVALYSMGRTSVFMYIIMLMILYAFTQNNTNLKLIKKFSSVFLISIIFFGYYSSIKYSYTIEGLDLIDSLTVIFKNLAVYSSGSLIAFSIWATSAYGDISYGENSLRFLYALLNSIGFDTPYTQLVQEFTPITYEYSTNVYTIYHYYASDFGFIYALIIQIILGGLYVVVYRKAKEKQPMYIFSYALLVYPLLMQFFQDQYISLTSTWIQNLLFVLFIFKTSVIAKNNRRSAHNEKA